MPQNWVTYFGMVFLYGVSLEVIYAFDRRAAWVFMGIVSMGVALSYPNVASEILWFTGSAQQVSGKTVQRTGIRISGKTVQRTGKGK